MAIRVNRMIRNDELFDEDGTEIIENVKKWYKIHDLLEELHKFEPYFSKKCFILSMDTKWLIYFKYLVILYDQEKNTFHLFLHKYTEEMLERFKNPGIKGKCKFTCKIC